ncbi:hypothetical protein CTAYLR_001849 [Chrysophaeum taylorii]|uniref:FYVE-type domain-containing protein n=1 Tax=Chrysophaeum taylorii TaxID=2483200 RepID=A0AAD7XG62_9STRA|nr:hypothetical protein CTAYLR_001849 [Chrysophaeum taylorii]
MARIDEYRRGGGAPRWMNDDESETCMGCNLAFDSVNRRHHCRRCGMLYCSECSNYKALVHPADAVYPPDWDSMMSSFDPREPLRVCRGCYLDLEPQQEELLKTTSNAAQPTEIDRQAVERYLNVPIQFDMRSEIMKATHTLYNFCEDNAIEGSDSVPRELISSAWGLAFVTTMQAGFFFSARMGSGLVIGRTPDGGWSAPSAVCTAGAGWGLQIGGEVTDMLVVLNSQDAVDAFASTAQLTLGTELSLALGPMGRSAETNMTAGDNGVSAVFSYAHSKGFFVGIALHACMILARPDCNEKFYGKRYDVATILSGTVDRPVGAEPLYRALEEVLRDSHPLQSAQQRSISGHEDLDISKIRIRQVDAALPHEDDPFSSSTPAANPFSSSIPPADPFAPPPNVVVRASPLTAREQEQIDADLALAIALSEEEAHQAAVRAAPPQNPPPPPPAPQQRPAVSDWTFGLGGGTSSYYSSKSHHDASGGNDDWDKERRLRLTSRDEDFELGAEELKPIKYHRVPRPDEAAYPEVEDEVTL